MFKQISFSMLLKWRQKFPELRKEAAEILPEENGIKHVDCLKKEVKNNATENDARNRACFISSKSWTLIITLYYHAFETPILTQNRNYQSNRKQLLCRNTQGTTFLCYIQTKTTLIVKLLPKIASHSRISKLLTTILSPPLNKNSFIKTGRKTLPISNILFFSPERRASKATVSQIIPINS